MTIVMYAIYICHSVAPAVVHTQVFGERRHYTWWFKVESGRCGVGI